MVVVALVKICASEASNLSCNFHANLSADNCIGVSGLRISCANRLATSPHAASFCARTNAVILSNTNTQPLPFSAGNRTALPNKIRLSSRAK